MSWKRLIFVATCFVTIPNTFANLQVYPTRVVLDDKARVSQLTLSHSAPEAMTYEIVPVFYEQDNLGRMTAIEGKAATDAALSAASLLRFSPRVFSLKAGETQTLKIRAQPKAGLNAGIYRIHLRIQPAASSINKSKKIKKIDAKPGGASLELTAQLAIAVPVYFSHGNITRKLSVESLSFSADKKKLSFVLKQEGNGFVFGDIFAFVTSDKSKDSPKEVGRLLSMASYAPERRVEILLDAPFKNSSAAGEKLRLEIRQSPDEGSALIFESETPTSAFQ